MRSSKCEDHQSEMSQNKITTKKKFQSSSLERENQNLFLPLENHQEPQNLDLALRHHSTVRAVGLGESRFTASVTSSKAQVQHIQGFFILFIKTSCRETQLLKCCHDNSKSTKPQEEGGWESRLWVLNEKRQWGRNPSTMFLP